MDNPPRVYAKIRHRIKKCHIFLDDCWFLPKDEQIEYMEQSLSKIYRLRRRLIRLSTNGMFDMDVDLLNGADRMIRSLELYWEAVQAKI